MVKECCDDCFFTVLSTCSDCFKFFHEDNYCYQWIKKVRPDAYELVPTEPIVGGGLMEITFTVRKCCNSELNVIAFCEECHNVQKDVMLSPNM